jgi:crotonobetainyl-CoA:carnitine CoA-transferase CaiB-like acyl-CoA transferase
MPVKPEFPPYDPRPAEAPAALTGIRVIDFTRVVAGAFSTMILADLGAEIIKVEDPINGDITRFAQPRLNGTGVYFLSVNRNKRSITLDLNRPEGRKVAMELIANADILVENYTTRVMKKFGLDYASLCEKFPKLIYCSVSAYGREGSMADAPGYDPIVASETGCLSLNSAPGERPVVSSISYIDFMAAMNGTIGVLAALHARDRLGKGQHIDVSMYDTGMSALAYRGFDYIAAGVGPNSIGRVSNTSAPGGEFDASDGTLWMMVTSDKMFKALCERVIERPELVAHPEYVTRFNRERNCGALMKIVQDIFITNTREYWIEKLRLARVPVGSVRTVAEAVSAPIAVERNAVSEILHPTLGTVATIASVFRRMSLTPAVDPIHAPTLGQHTEAILRDVLHYDEAKFSELLRRGAFGSTEACVQT